MKSRAAALLAPVREWFVLERAERTAREYTTAQQVLIAEHARAAECRMRAARGVADAVPAATLLLSSVKHLLRAKRRQRATKTLRLERFA